MLIRRKRLVSRIWKLGDRPVFELIQEIERFGVDGLDARLSRYADLDNIDQRILHALGADTLWFPPAVRLVQPG